MANTSSRTLRLLSLLQGQRSWSGHALADRLGISARTLRRDVDRLRELGYPVDSQRGTDGGYQLAAGAVLPPLLLDDEEAVALAVGLHAATSSSVSGMAESSVRALAKVSQVMPARLRRRVDTLQAMTVTAPVSTPGPHVDPTVLTTVAQACRDDERLRLDYSAADGQRSERTIEPHRLVRLGSRWYLVAYDLSRHDWRSFRVDRVEQARADGTRYRPRTLPAEDAAAFVRQRLRSLPTTWEVSATVAAPVEHVRARIGRWVGLEEVDAQSCRLSMRTDSLDWAALALGASGAALTDVTPPELVENLHSWASRFAAVG